MQNQNDEHEALRQRLQTIAERFSQAEIARRTGASKANVHRYLKSGRIPGDFLQGCAREFGLNPAWLLLGRGEMLQSEVSDQAASQAGDLFELVVKLNAIGHERLGSLQNKDSARMARELSDALNRHEQVQKELFARSRPIYLELLNRYRVLIGEHRHDETAEVLDALHQLVRLNPNPAMEANVAMLEAVQRFFEGDLARQRELHLTSMATFLKAGRVRDAQFLRMTYNTCVGLATAGRLSECARLANAVIQLADSDPPRWEEDWLLRVPQAIHDLAGGEPGRAVGELTRIITALSGEFAERLSDSLLYAGYLVGMTPFEDVVGRWSNMAVGSPPLLLVAFWEPGKDALRLTRASRTKMEGHPDRRSQWLLDALQGVLDGRVPVPGESGEPVHELEMVVIACEGALRLGDGKKAGSLFRRADKLGAALDDALRPDFTVRAMLARQALELGSARQKADSHAFIERSLLQGYGMLKPLAEEQGIAVAESWQSRAK